MKYSDGEEQRAERRTTVPWGVSKVKWKARDIQNARRRDYDDVLDKVYEGVEKGDFLLACCNVVYNKIPPNSKAISLFEVKKGHAIDFFAKRHGWSKREKDMAIGHPIHQCYSCCRCRYEYALWLVFSRDPLAEALDFESLQGALSFVKGKNYKCGGTNTGGTFSGFLPSFYGVGAFNGALVKTDARTVDQQLSTLKSQITAERVRYLVTNLGEESALSKNLILFPGPSDFHPSLIESDQFHDRFVYDFELNRLFQKSAKANFPISVKDPVGLNPERFIETCRACKSYMVGSEFGTEFCSRCSLYTANMGDVSRDGFSFEKLADELMRKVDSQAKEIDELKEKLAMANPIELVDLTEDDSKAQPTPVRPKSQLAALHEQAKGMVKVKSEALQRAAKAEKRMKEVLLKLECPMCFEQKDESVALGCGHVMCSDCVKDHAEEICPTCRKTVETRIILFR